MLAPTEPTIREIQPSPEQGYPGMTIMDWRNRTIACLGVGERVQQAMRGLFLDDEK